MVALQRLAGNRATGQLLARRRAAPIPAHAGLDVAALLAAQVPELLPLIDAGEIGRMQARYDTRAYNTEVGRRWDKSDQELRSRYIDPEGEIGHGLSADLPSMRAEEGPLSFSIPTDKVLSEDILAEPPRNRRLENAFRKWMHDELMKDPTVVVSIDAVALGGAERNRFENEHPDAVAPQTKNQASLVSGGRSLPHSKGKVHFRDLVGSTFAKDYDEQVVSNPAVKQLRDSLHEVQEAIVEMSVEHQLRIDANKDHPVVRRIAEFLGGGDEIKAWLELAKEIQEHPERGTWEERQEELSTECPPIGIWNEPQKAADEARATINEDFEIGAIAYMRAEAALNKAARLYQRYEERVMKGAAIAVKWLGRAKFAGKIAAAALPGSAPVNAAIYSLVQEGGQQVVEVSYGQRKDIDVGGLAKQAGMEGAMALFAGLTQGAFAERLAFRMEARFGEEVMAQYGVKAMDLASNKFIVAVGAAATSAPYNLAASKVLERIIYGRTAMPKSVDDLADMVLDEVTTSISVAGVMQGVHSAFDETSGAKPREDERPPGSEEHGRPDGGSGGGGGAPGGGGPGGAVPEGGRPPRPPLGQESAIKYAALARSSPAAAEALIDHLGGRWEVAIEQIQKGTGELAQVDPFARRELVRDMLDHRAGFLKRIGEKFKADPVGEPTASSEPGSDVDLNLKGEDAGLRVAQATEYLNENHPGWQQRYRMGLLVEAGRARSIADHAAKLPRELHEKLNQWQTMATEASLVSREARAAADPAERAKIVQQIGDPTWRKFAQEMADLSPEAASDLRIQYAARGDRTYSRIDQEAPPEARYEQIREAMADQMMANALDPDAYVSGGAIRSVVFKQKTKNPAETYGSLIDQVAMLQEKARESGGMRKALRRYETYKYVQRIAETVRKAGIEEKSANYLYNQAELYANVDRSATSTADPRVISADDLTNKAVTKGTDVRHEDLGPQDPITDEHLEEIYGMVKQIVDTQGTRLRREALGLPSDDQTPLPVNLPELEPREPAPPAPVGPGGVPPGPGGPQGPGGGGPGGGGPGGYQRPPRTVLIDANVLDQINRGNASAANALLNLAARGEVFISRQAYNEAVLNPLMRRGAEANRLLLEELEIPIAPAGDLGARVDARVANETPGGTVLSPPDVNVASQGAGIGAEVWSYDGPYRDNTPAVQGLGVDVAPESFFALAVEPADYRVGRFLLGLPEVQITLTGVVLPPGGTAPPGED